MSAHKTLVRQQDQSDCGVACLASIINFLDGDANFEQLRQLSGTSQQGTTLLGLQQAAQAVGLHAEGLEAESAENLSGLNNPAILHVLIEERLQHYVVFYEFIPDNSESNNFHDSKNKPGNKVRIGDPAKGIIEMSVEELNRIWKSKKLLSLTLTDKFEKAKEKNNRKIAWIIQLIKSDYPILVVSLFLGIAASLLGISTAIFSQKLIDNILPEGNHEKLIISLVLVTFLLLARGCISFIRGVLLIRQSQNFNDRIIQNFYNNLLGLPKSFFDTRKIGDLIARMNDTRRIQSVLTTISGSIIIDFLVVIISIAFVFAYSSLVAFILIISLPLYVLILYSFNKPVVQAQKKAMEGYAIAESNFIDTMQGITDIKLLNKHAFFERMNSLIYGEFQKRIAVLGRLTIKFTLISDVASVIFVIGIFGTASWLVLSNELKLGEMVALLSLAGSVTPSLNRLIVSNIQIQEALVAFNRMYEFTSIEKEENTVVNREDPLRVDNVVVQNLSFRFPGRKQVLKNISMQLDKGELVALMGESGQGKSTLVQLLQKFYEPESGVILVDSRDLNRIGHSAWRSQIGSIPQEPKIFNGNLLYNIALSDSEQDFNNAISFCEQAGFDTYFNQLPQGYLTTIGEEGVNLSGGQKQLVVLARVLLKKPKFLILDEATSAMDKDTENFILELIQKEKNDRITLIITHRFNPTRICDKIYVLENSSVVNSGFRKN